MYAYFFPNTLHECEFRFGTGLSDQTRAQPWAREEFIGCHINKDYGQATAARTLTFLSRVIAMLGQVKHSL